MSLEVTANPGKRSVEEVRQSIDEVGEVGIGDVYYPRVNDEKGEGEGKEKRSKAVRTNERE